MKNVTQEEKYERWFRQHPLVVPLISFIVLGTLFTGIAFCAYGFTLGHYWTIFPAGLMAHAYFIISIHDGSHRAITRTRLDDVMMNVFAGLLLLPFFPEPFRRYHLIHHANTNTENDPLWSPLKQNLFSKHRFLYILCQLIPVLFTGVVLLTSEKSRNKKNIKGPKMRFGYMLLAFACSGLVIWFFQPPVLFYAGTLLFLNFLGGVRHWCEHMGVDEHIESNTYWFPLGMGVGNHSLHHDIPGICWLSLALGLRKRKRDTNPFRTIYHMVTKKSFQHYKARSNQKAGSIPE